MTTMHHPPSAIDLVADAYEHHEKLSFPEAARRAAAAAVAHAANLAQLRIDLAAAEARGAQAFASGDRTQFAVQAAIAQRLRKQIEELES